MTMQSTAAAFETPSTSGSEEMSAAELAYFESGGRDTEALEREHAGNGDGAPPAGKSSADGQPQGADQTGASDDPDDLLDDDGEMLVTIGADGKPRDKGGKFVPHKAFHAVREKYKATRAELAETKEKFTRYDERLQTVNALLQQASQPAQPAAGEQADDVQPDPEKDIFAYVAWQGRKLERLQAALNEKAGNFEKHTAEQQFRTAYISDATAFVQQTPDFRDAYSHLVSGRDKELQAIGMSDAAARKAYIAKEERALVEQAMQQGVSPSQVLYNLAKARGFTGPAPKAGVDNAQKISQIAQSQKVAGNPLSNAGGTSGEGLTPEAIANMSEADFDAAMSKLSAAQKRALFGA